MSRVIKFRAWNKHSKKMFNVLEIWFKENTTHPNGPVGALIDTSPYAVFCGFDVLELMQFTGLHDRLGKEIWEGDIVQFHFNKDWCEGDYLPRERFEVSLEVHRLWCKGEMFGHEGELLLEPRNSEVLGNIYENPELLKP